MGYKEEKAIKLTCEWAGCTVETLAIGPEQVRQTSDQWGAIPIPQTLSGYRAEETRLIRFICPEHFRQLTDLLLARKD
jgi:hypothetical protein